MISRSIRGSHIITEEEIDIRTTQPNYGCRWCSSDSRDDATLEEEVSTDALTGDGKKRIDCDKANVVARIQNKRKINTTNLNRSVNCHVRVVDLKNKIGAKTNTRDIFKFNRSTDPSGKSLSGNVVDGILNNKKGSHPLGQANILFLSVTQAECDIKSGNAQ